MTVTVGGVALPASACRFVAAESLACGLAAAGGAPRSVSVQVDARPEQGGRSVLINALTFNKTANETDAPGECDFCNLQFPATLTAAAGAPTALIYGRIYEAGLTDVTHGPVASISAQVGYGPPGTSPAISNRWVWVPAAFNQEYGNDDEYQGSLTVPSAGSYLYTFRFSLDGGSSWSYGDLDGAGSNAGLIFEASKLGVLTVN
jgi:hypothetical protein